MLCASSTRASASGALARRASAALPCRPRLAGRRFATTAAAASEDDNGAAATTTTTTTEAPTTTTPPAPAAPAAAPSPPVLIKGQGTAIVTGAFSILFGMAYLALAQFMSSRGGEMLPPPPEAFLP
jgi:hypothetical protein